jgi:hypothetical protein
MSKFTELIQGNISDINQVSLYGATSIESYTFASCSNLTSITIPNSVTSIGNWAFASCSGLTSIIFAEESKLTSIGGSAFSGCSSLTSITIPESVTNIGRLTFAGTTTSSSKRLRINFLRKTPATIYSYSILQGGTFTITTTSSNSIYADVHIPIGSEATYRANSAWNTFFNSPNVTVTADL